MEVWEQLVCLKDIHPSEYETHYIQQYLAPLYTQSSTYPLKIGDDCAVIDAKDKILTSVDSSVEEQHFPKDLNPYYVAYRSVAVAISDIYAMGGIPESYLLSISHPQPSDLWFEEFSKGIEKVNQDYTYHCWVEIWSKDN